MFNIKRPTRAQMLYDHINTSKSSLESEVFTHTQPLQNMTVILACMIKSVGSISAYDFTDDFQLLNMENDL